MPLVVFGCSGSAGSNLWIGWLCWLQCVDEVTVLAAVCGWGFQYLLHFVDGITKLAAGFRESCKASCCFGWGCSSGCTLFMGLYCWLHYVDVVAALETFCGWDNTAGYSLQRGLQCWLLSLEGVAALDEVCGWGYSCASSLWMGLQLW